MSHRDSGSTSGEAILAVFVPTFLTAVVQVSIFLVARNYYRKHYAPRTFLGTVPEKDRTPVSRESGVSWFHDFWTLTDRFVLQHNSLDAYLYLRFLRFVVGLCFIGACLTWSILIPINATGGGTASQLDRISFSNIVKNDHIWAHTVVAWVFFGGILVAIAYERLKLIGIRQACFVNETYASRLSARTVLFLNVPKDARSPAKLKQTFGEHAERSWPLQNTSDLDELVEKRTETVHNLERAEMDLIVAGQKIQKKNGRNGVQHNADDAEAVNSLVPQSQRPIKRTPPVVGTKLDAIGTDRTNVKQLTERIDRIRSETGQDFSGPSAVFVAFSSQEAAHRAFQEISFRPRIPLEDRFLNVQPKEVLWNNLALPVTKRLSKSSFALVFVIAFTIFFSIPVGIIGTISNAKELADRVSWLSWLNGLPPVLLGLLTGLVPPFLTSWFVSYVPKLFRHIAKLSGEPTIPQAELKAQAWYMAFQVVQVFLITTFSSGTAAVATKIIRQPDSAPALLAASLPKASNFYLTYFILQGTASAASNLLNSYNLFEYLFLEYFWNKTPREKFNTYAKMQGVSWASWYPKFTNFFIIAVAYSCIAPLTVGFAAIGVFFYYLSYRYDLLYVRTTKIDTKGEAYKRALQQMPIALYLAELCLIGLFGARKAAAQTALMIVLLIITAIINFLLDRMLRPLDLFLGLDKWHEQQVPLLAEEDGIDPNDEEALHAAAHGRRLGLKRLPHPAPRWMSDFFDSIISAERSKISSWLDDSSLMDSMSQMSDEDLAKVYLPPALVVKTPKLWIPRDKAGVSRQEIELNDAAGIPTTDEAAEIDEHAKLHWNHNFEEVPIHSKPKVI